jgi:hypothetical protein
MPRVRRRRREAKVSVESGGLLILRMNGERTNADQIRYLKRASEHVEQQSGAEASALRLGMNGKTREYQQRDRVTRHAFDDTLWGVSVSNLTRDHCIEADDLTVTNGNIGLRRVGLLRLHRMPDQKSIEFRLAAGECFDDVRGLQFLNAEEIRHDQLFGSNTEGSLNKRSRRE